MGTPQTTNMEVEKDGSQRNLLFQEFIFRFHVGFAGCSFWLPS